jgi:hypothetical protein
MPMTTNRMLRKRLRVRDEVEFAVVVEIGDGPDRSWQGYRRSVGAVSIGEIELISRRSQAFL